MVFREHTNCLGATENRCSRGPDLARSDRSQIPELRRGQQQEVLLQRGPDS
jgi:hypothetical protein